MMHLVQLQREGERRVALVDGEDLRLLESTESVYALALEAIESGQRLTALAATRVGSQTLTYDSVYYAHQRTSEWRLLPAFDHPHDPAHCLVSGTGLTHKASAENRSAMHSGAQPVVTDSLRMYRMGVEGGTPEAGKVGVQPEWFYKGDGSVLRAHGEELAVPSYGEDGGEEPEIAAAYVISRSGKPFRVGLMTGDEFSDHIMEKRNYLYLAPSKLRDCAVGPELVVGDVDFASVRGTVSIVRAGEVVWTKAIWTGEANMCHSVANLEHHHFKYAAHRRPGDAHIHFFGADAFSFGEGVALREGDLMEVAWSGFGRALRNPLHFFARPEPFETVDAA